MADQWEVESETPINNGPPAGYVVDSPTQWGAQPLPPTTNGQLPDAPWVTSPLPKNAGAGRAPPFDPSKPFEAVSKSHAPPFDPSQPFEVESERPDPWAEFKPHNPPPPGFVEDLPDAPWAVQSERPIGFEDLIPSNQFKGIGPALVEGVENAPGSAARATRQQMQATFDELRAIGQRPAGEPQGVMDSAKREVTGRVSDLIHAGKAIANWAGVPATPIIKGIAEAFGPAYGEALHDVGMLIAPETAAKDRPEDLYNIGRNAFETASMAMRPSGVTPIGPRAPLPLPAPPQANGPMGVTLSEGQASRLPGATQNLPAIQTEQAALRGQLGPAAQSQAAQFNLQQAQEVSAATERMTRGFDPYNMRIAETPQEAGQVVQNSLQTAAAQRKADVQQAYRLAEGMPGEIHPDAFRDMPTQIKSDLSNRAEPVVIDDQLTPWASRALSDIEGRVSQLQIQNRASPYGQPAPNSIVGINLKGVDQMRRRLSMFRQNAFSSGNAADGRAAQAVLDSFDDRIDAAVNGGLFRGDPRAVQAWNDARAANADYRAVFTARKGDPVGRVVEKILGNGNNQAAIPNDVADYLFGSSGINPSSLNVGVAKRVQGILGDRSPEWSGVKQGLYSRLIEPAPGMTDWGPGKVAQRLNQFLNGSGKEMAETVFTLPERDLLKQYADLQRALEIPPTGVNRSETSTFMAPMMKRIGSGVAHLVGAAIGHMVAPGLYGAGELIGAGIIGKGTAMAREAAQARKIAKQMPLVADATRKWQQAVAAAQRKNTPFNQRSALIAQANLAHALQQMGMRPSMAGFAEAPSDPWADFRPKDDGGFSPTPEPSRQSQAGVGNLASH